MNLTALSYVILFLAVPAVAATETAAESEQTMLNLVNQARAEARSCGNRHFPAAPPLQWHQGLAESAQEHAGDMAEGDYFNHTDRSGRNPHQRIQAAFGYSNIGTAENIEAGGRTAAQALSAWLKSPGHCSNIMNPKHTHLGMAVAVNPNSKYRFYWVQTFAYRAY